MKKHLTSIILISIMVLLFSCQSETVVIPDINFKNALLKSDCIDTDKDGKADRNLDLNNDNKIQLSEIQNLEFLDVSSKNIKSLEGIEYFVNLKGLDCYKNELKNLNLTKNTKLETLFCFDNLIEELDLSKNTDLVELGCRGNKIMHLDLSQNTKLKIAYCYKNNLTTINLINGNNRNMTSLWVYDNPNLSCIELDDDMNISNIPICNRQEYSGWCKDSTAIYNKTCK